MPNRYNFSVGDPVICNKKTITSMGYISAGDTGIVREVRLRAHDGSRVPYSVGVEWDMPIGGHSLGGEAKEGHGWRFFNEHLISSVLGSDKPSLDNISVIEDNTLFEDTAMMQQFLNEIKKDPEG